MIKNVIWIYNTLFFLVISFIVSFNHEKFYLSSCRFNQLLGLICNFRVFIYGDAFEPNEKSVILCNHKTMYDILSIFYVSGYFNRIIGFCLKKQVSKIPGIGWWCTRMKFPTLNRNNSDLKILEKDTTEFPILIYPEGTRFSNIGYQKNCEFAKQNGFKISKYAQLPKSKGAFTLTKNIVYHMTLVYLNKHGNVITDEIYEFPSKVYIHVKKHIDVPKTEPEYKLWLHTQFANIDEIYDNFRPTNAIEMTLKIHIFDYLIYAGYALVQLALMYQLFTVCSHD